MAFAAIILNSIVAPMIQDTIVNPRRKTRKQVNYSSKFFAASLAGHESLITLAAPERTPQKCERYNVRELQPVDAATDGEQVIISEISTIGEIRLRIKAIRAQIRQIREDHRLRLRAEFRRLVNTHCEKAYKWTKTSTMAFRKAKWVKIPTGQSKIIRKPVLLGPRPRWYRQRYLDPRTLTTMWLWRFDENYRPKVYRELVVPVYQKIVVRKAGLRRVTIRKRTSYFRNRWDIIKPRYLVYKVEQEALLHEKLAPLERLLEPLIKEASSRMQNPRRLVSYTTTGWIPISDSEWDANYGPHREQRDNVYAYHALPPGAYLWTRGISSLLMPGHLGAFLSAPVSNLASIVNPQTAEELSTVARDITATRVVDNASCVAYTLPLFQHPPTVVGPLKQVDSDLVSTEVLDLKDDQAESLAASSTEHLRNKSDYVFNLPRSLAELKDSKQTFAQGREFVRWFAKETKTGHWVGQPMARHTFATILGRTKSVILAFAGVYLAWKFAIEPTIQDCATVVSNTNEWLLDIRRALRTTIMTLRRAQTNILHIRSKFRGDGAVKGRPLQTLIRVPATTVSVEIRSVTETAQPTLTWGSWQEPRGHWTVDCEAFTPSFSVPPGVALHNAAYSQTLAVSGQSVTVPGIRLRHSMSVADPEEPFDFLDSVNTEALAYDDAFTHFAPFARSYDQGELINKLVREGQPSVSPVVPGYVKNQVEGVTFARYQVSDLIEFLGEDSQLGGLLLLAERLEPMVNFTTEIDRQFNALDPLRELASSSARLADAVMDASVLADSLFVLWQIYPLSFVYDWVATSDSIVTLLNNFARSYFMPPPPSLDGTWITKRVELLAGRPGLQLASSKCYQYVTDLWVGGLRTTTYQDGRYFGSAESTTILPKRTVTVSELGYETDREVRLERTGLYVAKRGEFIANGWETFLPQVDVRLNVGKVGTLLTLLAGMIAGRK